MSFTRREFLTTTATSTAAIMAAPTVLARGATDKLNIAVVGVQGQGWSNITQIMSENIVALCDVDENRLAKAASQIEGAKQYKDFRVMLERQRDIDAVLIATPDHTHAPAAAMALGLGKHVYCEKPLAHTVHEARTLARLAIEKGVATQMGTQIHAQGNYRRVVELVRSGAIGRVQEAHVWCNKSWSDGRYGAPKQAPAHLDWDLWLGPAPEHDYCDGIHPANWRRFWNYGTGTLGDMACHYMDLVYWALDLGSPSSVEAEGPEVHDVGTPKSLRVTYNYSGRAGDDITVHWYDGANRPPILSELRNADGTPLQWGDGQLFVGDRGMIISDYGRHRLLPEADFKDFEAPPRSIPDSIGHHAEWILACKEGTPTTCNFTYSGGLTEAVLLGNVAYRVGRKLEWNGARLEVTNAPEAARLIRKTYREGWWL